MRKKPRTVITYGTFDLMHEGHIRLLRRAKALGDRLIVGVTSDSYDMQRGKLNVRQPLSERIRAVQETGLADMIIVEEYEGQKIEDIQRYDVDVFAIGSDWKGKFDYLKKYCEVVYLERTKGVSSTQLRGTVKLGIVGTGRIARRFVPESRYVSGVEVDWVYNPRLVSAESFASSFDLGYASDDWDKFIEKVDAVYIATPHTSHYDYARKALEKNKHVLIEKPMVLKKAQAIELFRLAARKNLVLLEALKTAFAPAFKRFIGLALSGAIGEVRHIRATFTKLVSSGRELDPKQAGGSFTELGSYVLLPFLKVCGHDDPEVHFRALRSMNNEGYVDVWTEAWMKSRGCSGALFTGLGVKSEGDLVISGTKGYIYVPAPWWKPTRFEIRREDSRQNEHFCDVYSGEGLRYEIAQFVRMIQDPNATNHLLKPEESIAMAGIIEKFLEGTGVEWIS